MWAYIGTYTVGKSHGIYAARFNTETGQLGQAQLVAKTKNPSFLAIHPSVDCLYAVGEIGDYQGQDTGFVRAFSIDKQSGQLTALNTQPSGGAAPCHLVVDSQGKAVLVANYSGGSVSSIALQPDGKLGEVISVHEHVGRSVNPKRQNEAHAHSINLGLDERFAYAADLGMDRVLIYAFDADTGRLLRRQAPSSAVVPAGSGPRHFALNPNGKHAYVINELLSTITVFEVNAQSGALNPVQNISTLPDGFSGTSHTAEVVVHPTGQFVYGSNRGHDSIAVFAVDNDNGQLERIQVEPTGGKTPRNFVVDPSGKFLLAENQASSTIVVFRIDSESGRLTQTPHQCDVPIPVCIRFVK